ncbi:hypothetical protein Nmel_016071, partial [Mimus melanotis]
PLTVPPLAGPAWRRCLPSRYRPSRARHGGGTAPHGTAPHGARGGADMAAARSRRAPRAGREAPRAGDREGRDGGGGRRGAADAGAEAEGGRSLHCRVPVRGGGGGQGRAVQQTEHRGHLGHHVPAVWYRCLTCCYRAYRSGTWQYRAIAGGFKNNSTELELFAKDLEMFARHAKRTTVTTEDVKLLARRSNSLVRCTLFSVLQHS